MENSTEKPAPRVPLKFNVSYRKSYARESDTGVLKNISLTGAFLVHNNPELQPHDKVNLVFEVSGRMRNIPAQIVWRGPQGSGLRFLPENNRDVQIVDDLIYFVENKRATKRNVLDNIFKKVS